MIDIHCHPLWETDDGARDFETSVAMCQMAAADGVTHLVATPHCNYTYPYDAQANRAKIEKLQRAVGDAPKLLLGCDFHLSYDNIQRCVVEPQSYTINGSSYLLVEFPDHFLPDQLDRVFYEIQVAGLHPIITHPERNPVFQRKHDLLRHWVSRDCLVQVTAQSLLGGFGSRARHYAEKWLGQNLVNFFASDAHDTRNRPPLLSACYSKVVELKGPETADLLLKKNPEAVIQGKSLPPQPLPAELAPRRKRRWFDFFHRDERPSH